jgi:hypothetical protein
MPGQILTGDCVRHTAAFPRLADISTVDQAAKAMRDQEMLAEIEDFIEGFNQPTHRGMRINGQRVQTWFEPARLKRDVVHPRPSRTKPSVKGSTRECTPTKRR